jgi:hypothetical protein
MTLVWGTHISPRPVKLATPSRPAARCDQLVLLIEEEAARCGTFPQADAPNVRRGWKGDFKTEARRFIDATDETNDVRGEFESFPIHVRRRRSLHPAPIAIVWVMFVAMEFQETLPGAHAVRLGRATFTPNTPFEFMVEFVVATIVAVVVLFPIFHVQLDVDETGIRKTVLGHEHFTAWSDIVDFTAEEKGGVRGRGAIRFIRRGENAPRKVVDLSPSMFGGTLDEFAAFLREGIARWGHAAQSSRQPDALSFGHRGA